MEESLNDYGWNDNSWDWHACNYEDVANYIVDIKESHLTSGYIKQAKRLPCQRNLSDRGIHYQ